MQTRARRGPCGHAHAQTRARRTRAERLEVSETGSGPPAPSVPRCAVRASFVPGVVFVASAREHRVRLGSGEHASTSGERFVGHALIHC